jgi:uncharacterized protein
MFISFFYTCASGESRNAHRLSPSAEGPGLGLITSLDDFYSVARAMLVKSERDFDSYDQVFAELFPGRECGRGGGHRSMDDAPTLLEEWLKEPRGLAKALG